MNGVRGGRVFFDNEVNAVQTSASNFFFDREVNAVQTAVSNNAKQQSLLMACS